VEYRETTGGDIRTAETDGQHTVTAKVCSYGVGPDTYKTTWTRGTFTDGFRSHGMPAIAWGHDSRSIIGSVTDVDDRPDGLYVTGTFANFDEVPKAREAFSLLRDGHVKGWSFGFADGETQDDPEHRGAQQFTKARMYEVSPVLRASIPLTSTVSVRSADGSEAEAATDGDLAAALTAAIASGTRSVTVTVNDAPADPVPTGQRDDDSGDDSGDDSSAPDMDTVSSLVAALDATLDEACGIVKNNSTDGLPPWVQQALSLLVMAREGAGSLMDELNIDDPDDDDPQAVVTAPDRGAADTPDGFSTKPWSQFSQSDYTDAQWDAACLIPGKLPVLEPDGTPNVNGIHAAASRIGAVDAPDSAKTSAARKLMSYYGRMKQTVPGGVLALASQRSADDPTEEQLRALQERLSGLGARRW
jgi:HK97 family phage prohead protease